VKKVQAGQIKPALLGPIVVVQWIEVEWGKDARGAEQATRRNQLPTALPLPELVLKPESEIVVQYVGFSDRSNFECPLQWLHEYERLSLASLPDLEIEHSGNQVVATMKKKMKWTDVYRPQIAVPLDAWIRVTWNRRYISEHITRYRQITLNFGYVSHYMTNTFLDQPPVSERSDLRNLY
jgi:hypothetical protein